MLSIFIGIDENGRPCVKTTDEARPRAIRDGKGKSLVKFPDDYTVIDIETTGLDSEYCDIIEVAALKYSNGKKIDEFCSFVKPDDPIDEYITKLTGITNEMVANAPDPAAALSDFCSFVQRKRKWLPSHFLTCHRQGQESGVVQPIGQRRLRSYMGVFHPLVSAKEWRKIHPARIARPIGQAR